MWKKLFAIELTKDQAELLGAITKKFEIVRDCLIEVLDKEGFKLKLIERTVCNVQMPTSNAGASVMLSIHIRCAPLKRAAVVDGAAYDPEPVVSFLMEKLGKVMDSFAFNMGHKSSYLRMHRMNVNSDEVGVVGIFFAMHWELGRSL